MSEREKAFFPMMLFMLIHEDQDEIGEIAE